MAISLQLIAVSKPGEDPWMMDTVEWLSEPIAAGIEGRAVHLNDSYQDWVVALSAMELLAWHQRDRHRAFEGVYAYQGWRDQLDAKIEELEALLASPSCPLFFIAHWFEWESGL